MKRWNKSKQTNDWADLRQQIKDDHLEDVFGNYLENIYYLDPKYFKDNIHLKDNYIETFRKCLVIGNNQTD